MPQLAFFLGLAALVGVNAECPNACSGHGQCGVFDQCSCFRNWQGNDCSERTCPFGHAHVDTPKGDLNMDGGALSGPSDPVVINSEVYPLGTTEQYPDAQDNEAHFYMECSNKGLCNRKDGECECFDGYDGSACQRASCPGGIGGDSEQCSGHGTCHSISYLAHHFSEAKLPLSYGDYQNYKLWDAGYTRGCACDPPFSGADCSSRDCKYGVDPLYVSTGTALYQSALVVNSCFANDRAGDGTYSTNGGMHDYTGVSYHDDPGTVPESTEPYEGYLDIGAMSTLPAWAVPGVEVIVYGGTESASPTAYPTATPTASPTPTPPTASPTPTPPTAVPTFSPTTTARRLLMETTTTTRRLISSSTTIGLRVVVKYAEINGGQGRLYVSNAETSSALDAMKTEASGRLIPVGGYSIAHVVNTFTLLFTDHHGEVYRTAPISAAVADYSMEVKAALEALPNNVISQVNVEGVPVHPFGNAYMEMGYKIDFVGNPGQLGALEIDSTPIRLGQTLQSGIECVEDAEYVYSSVGYYEIGEDATSYGTYEGNIIHFSSKTVTDSSGLENAIVYTSTDLTGLEGTLVKIGNEQYGVMAASTPEFLVLNTMYKGPSVTGTSTPIYTNDDDGADDSTDFDMAFSGTTLSFTAAYTEPTHDTNGDDIFLSRDLDGDGEIDNFGAGDIIRVTYDLNDFSFDCLFTIDSSTSTIADDAANSAAIDITVSEDPSLNCPTWSAAQTAGSGSITVQAFAFSPSAYTNGMYAANTRIFSSQNTFDESEETDVSGARQGADRVSTFDPADGTTPVDRSSNWPAGTIVLYENEFNVVESCDTTTCTFKNAMTTLDNEYDSSLSSAIVKHDIEYMYPVILSGDADYTYVSQCSNRGLCDGSSGLCQCFKGYTGDNCDTISELYA